MDTWVATADPATGTPYLVPLSFLWDGATVLISTPAASPTSRNLRATGKVRLGIGPTRDLVLIEGTVQAETAAAEIPAEPGDAFAAKTGFDPRELTGYAYFQHPARSGSRRGARPTSWPAGTSSAAGTGSPPDACPAARRRCAAPAAGGCSARSPRARSRHRRAAPAPAGLPKNTTPATAPTNGSMLKNAPATSAGTRLCA